jgi:lysozyme
MKTSPNGRALIEAWEGLILGAYDDATDRIIKPGGHAIGVLTIGYGHTSAAGLPRVYVGMTVTKEQADAILESDLAAVEADVNHHVKGLRENNIADQDIFDALVSFDFNTGGLDRSSVLTLFNAGHYDAAARALLAWDHVGRNVSPGLLRRRQDEIRLWHGQKWIGP